MITISSKANLTTLINVFTVEPANQRRLVELLTEATESSVGPLALPFFQEALSIARFEPGVYEVVRAFAPGDCSLPLRKCSRRIRPIVSTVTIPPPPRFDPKQAAHQT
jgi:hypothetical protein